MTVPIDPSLLLILLLFTRLLFFARDFLQTKWKLLSATFFFYYLRVGLFLCELKGKRIQRMRTTVVVWHNAARVTGKRKCESDKRRRLNPPSLFLFSLFAFLFPLFVFPSFP